MFDTLIEVPDRALAERITDDIARIWSGNKSPFRDEADLRDRIAGFARCHDWTEQREVTVKLHDMAWGRADILLASPHGDTFLVECKQAILGIGDLRRAIGQVEGYRRVLYDKKPAFVVAGTVDLSRDAVLTAYAMFNVIVMEFDAFLELLAYEAYDHGHIKDEARRLGELYLLWTKRLPLKASPMSRVQCLLWYMDDHGLTLRRSEKQSLTSRVFRRPSVG